MKYIFAIVYTGFRRKFAYINKRNNLEPIRLSDGL